MEIVLARAKAGNSISIKKKKKKNCNRVGDKL